MAPSTSARRSMGEWWPPARRSRTGGRPSATSTSSSTWLVGLPTDESKQWRQAPLQRVRRHEPRASRRNFRRHFRGQHDVASAWLVGPSAELRGHRGRSLAGAAATRAERARLHDELHDPWHLLGWPGDAAQPASAEEPALLLAT